MAIKKNENGVPQNGWNEYSRLVLTELERLNENDEKLFDLQNLSYTEYAHFLNLEFDESICLKWSSGDIESYAQESSIYRISCYDYSNDNLSYGYLFNVKPILDMRLMQAGVRLANLFNNIFN